MLKKKLVIKQNTKINEQDVEEGFLNKTVSNMSTIDIANLAIEKLMEKLKQGYDITDLLSEMREWVKIREEAFKENNRVMKEYFNPNRGSIITSSGGTSASPNPYNRTTIDDKTIKIDNYLEPYKVIYYNSSYYGT